MLADQPPDESHAYKNGSGNPIDEEISHKVAEAFDLWKHIWPIAKFVVPVSATVTVMAYGAGIIQIPFARQTQVNEISVTQKIHDEEIKRIETGISKIDNSIEKLTEKVGDLGGAVRETKAEVRSLYRQPQDAGQVATNADPVQKASPAPASPHPAPHRVRREQPKKEDNFSIFSR